MFENIKRVLCLAPHPDDIELGCGATLARLAKEDKEIYYLAFSLCGKSVPKSLPKGTIKRELKKSAKALGLDLSNVHIFSFPVREFPKKRQQILEVLIEKREEISPDLVLIPSSQDIHQDHKTINEESKRAFKDVNLLGYELPWNNFISYSNLFVVVSETDINQKIKALKEYKSQENKNYVQEEFIKALAQTRGLQINQQYAEAFEIIRLISPLE
jgi:LmbE family N-acetylglucosaminyl deacetylase